MKTKSIVLSLSFTMLFTNSVLVLNTNAASTIDQSNSTSYLIENTVDEGKIIQVTNATAILNSDGEEIGSLNQNAILLVNSFNEELFEIKVDTMDFPTLNERLFIKKSNYIETSMPEINSICVLCTDDNLVKEKITFDKGVSFFDLSESKNELMTLRNTLSFSSYYKIDNEIVIKFNNQYFKIIQMQTESEPLITQPEVDTNNTPINSNTLPVNSSEIDQSQTQIQAPRLLKSEPIIPPSFSASDKYFEVSVDYLPVYDNSGGVLKPVGILEKGQVYPRVSDYGDWHQVRYGNNYGYVWEASTKVSLGSAIKNENIGLTNTAKTFKATQDTIVYDNTSGQLVPFFTIKSGQKYPIISDWGDWLQIDVAGRIGYVYSSAVYMDFSGSDKYFEAKIANIIVYDNSSGSLVPVGTLEKGQVYPRVSDYGDWHQVKYGNKYGYVWEEATRVASGTAIKNENIGLTNSDRTFKATQNTTVYDNTSGKLVPFFTIKSGEKYPIISDWGEWLQIDVAGRIGYVYKPVVFLDFKASDKYFEAAIDNLTIYDNSGGALTPVGSLHKGQVYPRVADYGDWHQIKFGNKYGFVWEEATKVASGLQIKNENKGAINSSRTFKVLKNIEVYDNTSGALVPFALINSGESYPIIADYGDWLQIDVSGRIGFVYKDSNYIQLGPTIANTYRSYNYTLNQFLSAQMAVSPQTDLYRNLPAYVSKEYVTYKSDENHTPGYYVTADKLNIRENTNSDSGTFIYGSLKYDDQVLVLKEVNGWYQIISTWRNAKAADTLSYLDPNANSKFQHLRLDILADVPTEKLNNILSGKGILAGKGQAFKDASQKYGVNEVYLVSHAMLETGNGTSQLSTGVPVKVNNGSVTIVDPLKEAPQMYVYNMYGIGAFDSCALQCGAQTAYEKGWTTPEKAIIYGAEFVKKDYIGIGQNTIYKMRWNPDFIYYKNGVLQNKYPGLSSAIHQYATDIGWAVKQTKNIENIYQQLDYYNVVFEIPVFK